jgi:hypothetical protein
VKDILLDEEVKRRNCEEKKHQSSGNVERAAFASATYNKAALEQKFRFKCCNCRKIGHKMSECRSLQQNRRMKAVNTEC